MIIDSKNERDSVVFFFKFNIPIFFVSIKYRFVKFYCKLFLIIILNKI
jgi:hypothetical protein